jgi:hypothetical protein
VKSGSLLSTQFIDRILRYSFINCSRLISIFFFALIVFSSACTNIGTTGSRGPSSFVNQVSPSEGANLGAFKLTTVLPSQISAGTLYDMVGENGEFDTFCSGSFGVCKCEYNYTLSGGGGETQTGNVVYQESNLLRCENAVPSGIANFNVRIIVEAAAAASTAGTAGASASDYASNSISVNLSSGSFAGSDSYLDLSNAQSFVAVNRFQCRRRTFIANPLDSTIIDPIQSEDPKIIYPFNFFTTNANEGLLQMQRLSSQEWECTLTANQDRSLHWWSNPFVFSASTCATGFCSGDAEQMYSQTTFQSGKIPVSNPVATGKRRSSFSVASRSYGVFQIPIKAAVGPKDFVSANYAVIGYGARPIPSSNGSASCPNIPLPPKATWVKLWNYRATDITPPRYVTGSNAMTLSAIVCNPKQGSGIFPSCDATVSSGGLVFGKGLDSAPAVLASRVAVLVNSAGDANACYNIDTSNGSNWTTPAAYPNGVEYWASSNFAFNNSTPASSLTGLPWNLYTEIKDPHCQGTDTFWRLTTSTCTGVPGEPVTTPTPGVPSDTQVTTALLADDANDPKNFTDQLFVVTDPAVDDSLMRNQALSVSQYKPVTYRQSTDCNSNSRATCPASKEIHWDVNVKEIGSATSADIYPLCVLQFYD